MRLACCTNSLAAVSKKLTYMYVWACVSGAPEGQKEELDVGTGIAGGCELPMWVLELNF